MFVIFNSDDPRGTRIFFKKFLDKGQIFLPMESSYLGWVSKARQKLFFKASWWRLNHWRHLQVEVGGVWWAGGWAGLVTSNLRLIKHVDIQATNFLIIRQMVTRGDFKWSASDFKIYSKTLEPRIATRFKRVYIRGYTGNSFFMIVIS